MVPLPTEANPEVKELNTKDTKTRETIWAIQARMMLKLLHPQEIEAKLEVKEEEAWPKEAVSTTISQHKW